MLTKDDLTKIQVLITTGTSRVVKYVSKLEDRMERVEEKLETAGDKINFIPMKEEYFSSMDKLMGEVRKVREEQEIIGEPLSQHSDRLEKLEEKVGTSSTY